MYMYKDEARSVLDNEKYCTVKHLPDTFLLEHYLMHKQLPPSYSS